MANRSFSSFNTPEAIRADREWMKAMQRVAMLIRGNEDIIDTAQEIRDQLPAHYRQIKVKRGRSKASRH